jgi:hypothetical protein
MLEFLSWVGTRERTYEEAMEAWRTSCPRFSTWEDASIDGYVRLEQAGDELLVSLTTEGRDLVDGS